MKKEKIILLKENFNIKALQDYGFKYDQEKKVYKNGGLCCFESSRAMACTSKTTTSELAVLIDLYDNNIIEVKISEIKEENESNEELVKKTTKVARKG